jgi:hypothetical protein
VVRGTALKPETDGFRDPLGLKDIHDLCDIALDVRRRITIKKKEEIQEKAAHLSGKFFVPDLLQPEF